MGMFNIGGALRNFREAARNQNARIAEMRAAAASNFTQPPAPPAPSGPIDMPTPIVAPPVQVQQPVAPPVDRGIIEEILESIGWTTLPATTPTQPVLNPVDNDSPVALPSDNISSFKPQDFVSSNSGKSSSGFVGLFGMPHGKNQPATSALSPQGIPTQALLIVGGLLLAVVSISLFRR